MDRKYFIFEFATIHMDEQLALILGTGSQPEILCEHGNFLKQSIYNFGSAMYRGSSDRK